MPVYGKLNRLTSNPNPRQYVSVKPLFDPSKPMRFCEFAGHWTTEDAPDPAQKGCPLHRSVKWRSKYKPGGKGKVITERWCKTCNAFRPREQFVIRPAKRADVSAECNDCRSRRGAVATTARLKRCGGCGESYPYSEFGTYTLASGKTQYTERCSACFRGPRKMFAPDPVRDARIIQQFLEGKPQRLIADLNEVSRGYVVRIVAAHRKLAA